MTSGGVTWGQFFEIPVYKRDRGRHYAHEENRWRRRMGQPLVHLGASDESIMRARRRWLMHDGIPWKYNKICGWIALSVHGARVKADAWVPKSRPLTRKAYLEPGPRVFEFLVTDKSTDAEIVTWLSDGLLEACRRAPFKGKYVDLEAIVRIAPYVSWKKLLLTSLKAVRKGL